MIPVASDTITRRDAVRFSGVGLAVALAAWTGAASAQEATPTTAFAGETFVGEADDGETYVAIVVAEGDDAKRQVRAYLCDADRIDEWLIGTTDGTALVLADEAITRLTAELGDESITGEALLPGETALTFEAERATGVAGLYHVMVEPDGTLRGTAATGSRLEGRIEAEAATPVSDNDDDAFLFKTTVTLIPEDGEPVIFTGTTSTAAEGTFRMIVLNDGRSNGGGESATGTVKWKSTR